MVRATVLDVDTYKQTNAFDEYLLPTGADFSTRDSNLVYDKDYGIMWVAKIMEFANSTDEENAERIALAAADQDIFGAKRIDRLKGKVESCSAFEQGHRSISLRNMDKDVTQMECIIQVGLVLERELGYDQ